LETLANHLPVLASHFPAVDDAGVVNRIFRFIMAHYNKKDDVCPYSGRSLFGATLPTSRAFERVPDDEVSQYLET
jgi:hypothetical protein